MRRKLPDMRPTLRACLAVLVAGVAVLVTAPPATAHVVPSTVIELDVHSQDVTAALTLSTGDLTIASGIDVPTTGTVLGQAAQEIAQYVEDHFAVSSPGGAWGA